MATQSVDRREIVITFRSEGNGGASSPEEEREEQVVSAQNLLEKHFFGRFERGAKRSEESKYTAGAVATYAAITIVEDLHQMVVQQIEYSYNRVYNLTDNYVMQRDVAEIYGSIQKGVSFGRSIIAGALVGAKGGPVGAVIGAATGLATSLIKQGISIQQNRDQYKLQMAQSTINNAYNRSRLGYYLTDMGANTYN